MRKPVRRLCVVLGDQLNRDSLLFEGFDPDLDLVWMAESRGEATHVWSHKARIALFLSAMRHFRDALLAEKMPVAYRELTPGMPSPTLREALAESIRKLRPGEVVWVWPGEHRVRQWLREVCVECGVPGRELSDRHFLCEPGEFDEHADGRKQLRMEYFYRAMRHKTGLLMDGGKPVGGVWNFDADNRESFGSKGPESLFQPRRFQPDGVTMRVLELVESEFGGHPGSLRHFGWPVTRAEALEALEDFVRGRLARFGRHQDAMWSGEPFLAHSLLSSALNLKLLGPLEVARAAEEAHRRGEAPLASAEGFIRQVIGWREFSRGVYWRFMPGYADRNSLGANLDLPRFYWTGETSMNCLRETIRQTLDHGYAHHIQRLMVTGLYALLHGVDPKQVHEWYLAVYVDAVEWVELPNTLGMSQYADGGVMASKPYVASGKYLNRMGNYCAGCRFNPDQATGESACPFTTLYWDFLLRHEELLRANPRMGGQLRNVARLSAEARAGIQEQAKRTRAARPL